MYNNHHVKLAALKLCQLAVSDQKWILKKLPEAFSSKVKVEINTLRKFGIMNSSQLASDIEKRIQQHGLDKQMKLIKSGFFKLSSTDHFLICQSLDDTERNAFCDDVTDLNVQPLKLLQNKQPIVFTNKFKELYLRHLAVQLDDRK